MKLIWLSIWLGVPALVQAQAPNPTTSAPAFTTSGAFFALSVADISASSAWYTEKLGLRIVLQPPKSDQAEAMVLEGGGLIVELVRQANAQPLANAAPGVKGGVYIHGIFKAGLIVDDFERTLATLRARHVDIALGPFPAHDGQRANVIIRDNAGNFIQLFGK